jgi:putative sugar O-methyltransferase
MNLKLLFKPRKLLAVVKARYEVHRGLNQAVGAGVKRFKEDPNYRPDLIAAGCAPHPGPEQDDSAILKRIIAAYKRAKVDQESASETFNVSYEWLHIYARILGPVMQALQQEDLPELNRMYSNFFRDPCSQGLAGLPLDIQRKLFLPNPSLKDRNVLLVDVLHRFDLWKERTGNKYLVNDLVSPPIGNPYGHIFDGVFIRGGSDYHHYYAQYINSLLPTSTRGTVIELGGGFGGMAYFLIRDNPNVTYVDFDLPEALALASYYLLKAFPDLPITLYGEAELSSETLNRSRIVMMPSFEIKKMATGAADVAFNSYSLAEMSPATIREYVAELTRSTRGHLLHINHNRHLLVSADDFGLEDHGFTLLQRRLAGWTVGLNPDSDEFEYLYKAKQPV